MALAAVLRAARPTCRCVIERERARIWESKLPPTPHANPLPIHHPHSTDADRLAFAVHAYMLSDGYKLTAAGAAAEGDGECWEGGESE